MISKASAEVSHSQANPLFDLPLPVDSLPPPMQSGTPDHPPLWLYDGAIAATNCGVVIADATLPERPIIYCNPAFEQLTGYARHEVIGHNCRFLQGPDTDPAAVDLIRQQVRAGQKCQVVIKNYRKDGTPFWNELYISPVRNADGQLTHFIGVQNDITERKQTEALLKRQAERERLMRSITQRIYQSLDVEDTLNAAVAGVRQLLQADRTLIYRFDANWGGTVAVESVGEGWASMIGLAVQDQCFRETHVPLYQQGRVRSISNIYTADLATCHVALLERFDVKANLVVPILQSGKLWGLLITQHCSAPRQWQPDDIELLEQLSVQLAIALHQSELHQQLCTELDERRQTEAALRHSEAKLREKTLSLEQALMTLKRAQTQLIQSEKMSSLGQLVAGVAHEINNPVSFVHGNLKYVQDYTQTLLELVRLCETHRTEMPECVQRLLIDQELQFMVNDLPKSLSSMGVGTERIREIVDSLRRFSRVDEAGVKAVDLHDGIDSTLMILSSRFRPQSSFSEVEIIKDYSALPVVDCYPGQLNQVFMNILSNALDALEEHRQSCALDRPPMSPMIQIQTRHLGDRVQIRIGDNGGGIPNGLQQRIFDPFFTTKAVGKGTGLGLAISYQIIVDKHQGQLTCESVPNKGTTFIIELPIKQPQPTV